MSDREPGTPIEAHASNRRSFERFASRVPIVGDLGYRLLEEGETEVEIAAPVLASTLQVDGWVHGGMLAALADTAGAYLLYRNLPPGRRMTSIEFKLNFLRPAVGGVGDLRARARIVKQGRQVTLCEIDVAQGGELVAKGLFTYLLLPPE